jgi:nucleotide-binding universal stress UspA family protein
MAYRDIMVILDNHDADQACLSAAILVAKASKASLVGAFLSQAFVYPYIGADFGAYVPSDVIQKLADDHGAKQMIASQQAKLQFDAAVSAGDLTGEWAELELGRPELLYARARLCDLVEFPKAGMPHLGLTPAGLATGTGGPVLLVPGTQPIKALGQNILLAWNDSRESANALRGAMPLVHLAGHVRVVCVGEDKTHALRQHLHRHQIDHNVAVHSQKDLEPEAVLDQEAMAMGADLVIMGLYGHNRLQEFVLGGVSRAVLSDKDAKVLLVAH